MTRSAPDADRHPVPSARPDTATTTLGLRSSGTSPSIHLLGAGKVGRAFLAQSVAAGLRVVAVTDRSATLFARDGLPAADLARWKRDGGALAQIDGAEPLPLPTALRVVAADVVVDALPSDLRDPAPALRRASAVLQQGAALALASKDALLGAAAELLGPRTRDRLGIDAALGGTGRRLVAELDALRACDEALVAGNATTTAVITQLERGAPLAAAFDAARDAGLLESDPTLDCDGSDARAKLSIVAQLLFGFAAVPERCPDLRELPPALLRERARRGATTRLIGRVRRDGRCTLDYEEVPPGAPWRVPADRVAYVYSGRSGRRLHVGRGIGAERTARTLLADVLRLAAAGGRR
jgi:homoserine dehydrogenase